MIGYFFSHLGSSSLITNLDGDIVQHIEYVPFGEVFIEERNNKWNTPYLFNAKDLDEETGLYYYGARYYDPRISIFFGVDPLVEKTGTPYQYCYQNPVKYIDPTGMVASTDVTKNADGTYTVVGGNLNDGDKNIYIVNNAKDRERTGEIIGVTTSETSFFYSDALDDKGIWAYGSIINPEDQSGSIFLENLRFQDLEMLDYMKNATENEIYDFKVRNLGEAFYKKAYQHYRGMPTGKKTPDGKVIYSSARDIGNMGAGYMAGLYEISWSNFRLVADFLESDQKGKISTEGISSQNAQKYGYMMERVDAKITSNRKLLRYTRSFNALVDYLK